MLQELMESEEMAVFTEANQELITESGEAVNMFVESLKQYVYDNPTIFMEAEIDDMRKNIQLFSEVATEQFLHEITAMNADKVKIVEVITPENALSEYI